MKRPFSWILLTCLIGHFVSFENVACQDGRDIEDSKLVRILYNVGHMANDIPQIDQFLNDGANSLEVDVRFQSNGIPTRLYHGVPCDCFRTCERQVNFDTFLDHIRQRSTPESDSYTQNLVLVFLDLKLWDVDQHKDPLYAAGDAIASELILSLFQNGTSTSKVWIVIGIPKVVHAPMLLGFHESFKRHNITRLLDRIGYEVTDEDNMDEVQQMFRGLEIKSGIWQGDGITNCVAGRSDARLRQAVAKRDAPIGSWINVDKVYRWTIDTRNAMRHSLRLGVDGIMTNDPEDVVAVAAEPEFSFRYRLATNADNPLMKIKGAGPLRFGCSRNWCWKDCTYTGKWCWTSTSGCSSSPEICSLDLECNGDCSKKKK